MAKLTLSIEPDKIAKAKSYAARHHTSVSKIVSDFLADITFNEDQEDDFFLEKIKKVEVPEQIKALDGILKGKVPDNINLWDAKYGYLKEKYGL